MKLEPTLDEDVAYGIRLLVDIARALAVASRRSRIRRRPCRRSTACTTSCGSSRRGDSRTAATATTAGDVRLDARTMSWEA